MADLAIVLSSLDAPRHLLVDEMPDLPSSPGIYAIYGDGAAWTELGLGEPSSVPLYVGKAEDSLVSRDLRTHFGAGRTGSSTVRRSFAALLREPLGLTGQPRNMAKPGHFANFGLNPEDDRALTEWMRRRLTLAVWTWDGSEPLRDTEASVLKSLLPPLNIAGVEHRWRAQVQAARKVMADQARAWGAGA